MPRPRLRRALAAILVLAVFPALSAEAKTRHGDYWTTYWDLYRDAKIRLQAAGIPMGAERHDVRVLEGPRPS